MIKYTQNNDDILCLPVGYMAQVVTLRGDVIQGTVTDVDILEETVTLEHGRIFTYEVQGYIERDFGHITVTNNDVVACISTFPLWNVIAGTNTLGD